MKTTTRIVLIIALVVILSTLMSACGAGSPDTNQPAVGETLIDKALNAAANANGDGVVDTTPCNSIICP